MPEFLDKLMDTDFLPHGHCFFWQPDVLWLHVLSDGFIAAAYYAIPIILIYFLRRRPDLPFPGVFVLFAVFIFGCGTTHVMSIWTLWHPVYRLDGLIKLMTAIASVLTAGVLIPLTPRALALPSPAQWAAANRTLHDEIARREQSETALRQARDNLEQRVHERTAEWLRANDAVRESEHRFRALLNNATDLIAIVAADGTVRYVSPSHQVILGYVPENLIGRNAFDFVHPDEVANLLEQFRESTMRSCKTEAIEYRFRHADGGFRVLEAIGRNLCDDSAVAGIVVNSRDITARKRVEEAAREASQFSQQIIDSAQEGVVVYGRDLRYLLWNQFMERLTGVPAREALDRHVLDVLPFLREAGLIERLEEALAGKTHGPLDFPYHMPQTGCAGWASDTSGPLRNAKGEIIGVIGIVRDITDRKQAEEAAMARAIQHAIIAQLGQLALGGMDISDLMDEAVRQTADILNVPSCHVFELLPDGATLLLRAAPVGFGAIVGQATIAVERGFPSGYTMLTKEAVMVNDLTADPRFCAAMSPVGLVGGMTVLIQGQSHPFGVCGAFSDQPRVFTANDLHFLQSVANLLAQAIERKRVEEELERRVAERTTELAASNRELEAFSYSVSHDLRAPLRAIDGFSAALLEEHAEQLDSAGTALLERVRVNTRSMKQLIDALLGLARVTRSEVQRQPIDLTALACELAAKLHEGDPGRSVSFAIADGHLVEGDPLLLRVAMENLLGNAWKYTRKLSEARIEFGRTDDGVYFVRDNGAGFDMAFEAKLFRAFQRLHPAAEFEGTGIGLATVQRIIHRHGGRIWAEGEVGKGATFFFTLPSMRDRGVVVS